ncbi:MAG TPA: PilZ domain-containing protein [Planctomycetes bacterium]|nr:PilZ domain-containing protein [Planctomycetota bacterium]
MSLTVTLTVEGATFLGTLSDPTDPIIRVTFPHGSAPFIPLKESLTLLVDGEELPEPLDLCALPTSWHSSEEGDRVFFEVEERDRVRLRGAVHDQRSVRVPLRGARAVRVGLKTLSGDLSFESALVDISETGVGLIVSEKSDRLLCSAMLSESGEEREWYLELAFRLPGREEDSSVIAEIRYRRLSTGCVKYGLRFDQDRTNERFGDGATQVASLVGAYQERLPEAA